MADQKEEKKIKEIPKPEFVNCFIDSSASILEIGCGGVGFGMRNLTAGEELSMYSSCRLEGSMPGDAEQFDGFKLAIQTLYYALGGGNVYGDEGWDITDIDDVPILVTQDNIRRLQLPVIQYLAQEHAKFFRPCKRDTPESGQDD